MTPPNPQPIDSAIAVCDQFAIAWAKLEAALETARRVCQEEADKWRAKT